MKAIINIENKYSWLLTDDLKLRTELWRRLRFRKKDYYHTRLYQQKLWDGFVDFFGQNNGQFLTGILPEITKALKHCGVSYQIKDNRDLVKFRYETIDKDFLQEWNPELELYDYQVDFTNKIIRHQRGVIQAPTSSGKTNCMISILKSLRPDTPTLVLTNSTTLTRQNYEEMVKYGFDNVGRIYGKKFEPNIITCANVQSLHKIAKDLPKIKALVVDEIHRMMSKVPKKYYNKMKNCSMRVGVSATPFKWDSGDKCQKYEVKGYFGPIMKTDSKYADEKGILTTESLQKGGILAKSRCTFYPVREPDIPYEIYIDAVTLGIAQNWKFHNIVKRLVASLKGRTLILVERLEHGDALADLIPGSFWVQGKDNEDTRKFVIEKLKHEKGNVVGIATQGIFNAGINVFLHNLVNAAGGKAHHAIVQRMGRGLRVAEDKDVLDYYDFMFHINDYLLDHSKKRIKILEKEGHEVIVKEEIDF